MTEMAVSERAVLARLNRLLARGDEWQVVKAEPMLFDWLMRHSWAAHKFWEREAAKNNAHPDHTTVQ
jgi:hypothetical protein